MVTLKRIKQLQEDAGDLKKCCVIGKLDGRIVINFS